MNLTESNNPDAGKLDLWREAMAHLRYLNDEVWKRFQFFFAINIAPLFAMFISRYETTIVPVVLAALGIFLALVGRYVLARNRGYYLQMLLKKSLLEDELGLYAKQLAGSETDAAFPWRLTPEVVANLKQEPKEWLKTSVRGKGTIARWLFIAFEIQLGFYSLLLLLLALRWVR